MLNLTTETTDLLTRLNAVPDAVQQALAGAAATGEAKASAVDAVSRRAGARRLQPDRQAALARFSQPDAGASAIHPAALKAAAVQAALTALGRS
jgi:hypothetical protein